MVITFVMFLGALFALIALEAFAKAMRDRSTRKRFEGYARDYEADSIAKDGSCAWCGHSEPNNHVCRERV